MASERGAGARITKLGRYEVLNELGKGAMGVVYLAKDPVIGRLVAIKTIRSAAPGEDDSESREFRERFLREAQAAGILSHPNIVTIHDVGEDKENQTSFIAMEYIEGKNVKTLLAEKTAFTFDQIADIIGQVAEALDYAHRKGIIHRDIKPANIIITTDGKVKITDFGVAKVASSNLTTTGQFLGTPNYMSPEQVTGAPVDGRSDIFSLGVVLYELLTRRKPFHGENLTTISYKIVHEDFTPPADLADGIPPEFNHIVAKAMAKDPWNRYQRGKDFALALFQTKARFEEQKMLQDLGTMVAAAENLPTLKLSNLDELAKEGGPLAPPPGLQPGRPTPGPGPRPAAQVPPLPPAGAMPQVESGSESPTEEEVPAASEGGEEAGFGPTAVTRILEEAAETPSGPPQGDFGLRTEPITRDTVSAAEAEGPLAEPAPGVPAPPAPAAEPAPRPSPKAPPAARPKVGYLLTKAEVNPRYFWGIAGGAAIVLFAVVGYLFLRWHSARQATGEINIVAEKQAEARRQMLEEGKRLLAAGKYEESLKSFRQVLAGSPGNAVAREYSQKAEEALAAERRKAEQRAQMAEHLKRAGEAKAAGDLAAARTAAEAVLALDSENAQAKQLIEEVRALEEEARIAAVRSRKKETGSKKGAARPPAASGAPAKPAQAVPASPPQTTAGGSEALVRVVFESPIPEGHLMIAINDKIVFRKPFDFPKRKNQSPGGTVSESLTVPPGEATLKVWLTSPDRSAQGYKTLEGRFRPGESRTLRLELTEGKFSARLE